MELYTNEEKTQKKKKIQERNKRNNNKNTLQQTGMQFAKSTNWNVHFLAISLSIYQEENLLLEKYKVVKKEKRNVEKKIAKYCMKEQREGKKGDRE